MKKKVTSGNASSSVSKKQTVPTKGAKAPAKGGVGLRGSATRPVAAAKSAAKGAEPMRFAHPFFTATPQGARKQVPGVGSRLLDHIKGNLEPIPPPSREPTYTLAEIIGAEGAQQIASAGSIKFHTVGDTGRGADTPQGLVATAMIKDYDLNHPATSPAFFFHLGDVIYGINKVQRYRPEFYEPYVHYPGKIVAIAGNHDGEVFPSTDPTTLEAFRDNFCTATMTVPAIAGTIYRETLTQPGVYYLLDAPFVQIVAMYSNAAENPGFISGAIPGDAQKTWLAKTLSTIAAQRKQGTRKALIFATHHPPFTAGGHSPSTEMLADIDAVCNTAGVMPDMHLSGHAHSYQRYTRTVDGVEIAYVVVGTGGIGDQAVPKASGQVTGDHTFVTSFKGFGYLLVEVGATAITGTMFSVDKVSGARGTVESFTVDFGKGKVS